MPCLSINFKIKITELKHFALSTQSAIDSRTKIMNKDSPNQDS